MTAPKLSSQKSLAALALASTLFTALPVYGKALLIINGADVGSAANNEGVQFKTDNKLTVGAGEDILKQTDKDLSVTIDNTISIGTLEFNTNSATATKVNGKITTDTNLRLNRLNILNDSTVTFDDDVFVNNFTSYNNSRTVTLSGNTTSTNGFQILGNGSIDLGDAKTFSGNFSTNVTGTGKIKTLGTATINGNIGSPLWYFNSLTANANKKTIDLNGDTFVNLIDITAGASTINVAANKVFHAEVQGKNDGTINFTGSSETSKSLGIAGNILGNVNIAAGTLRLGGPIFSTNTTVSAGATLFPIITNPTITGELTLDGTLNLGDNILTVTNTYTQNAGSILKVNVSQAGVNPATSGMVITDTVAATINVGSSINVSVSDGVFLDKNQDIKVIQSKDAALTVPGTVTGGTLIYTFTANNTGSGGAGPNIFIRNTPNAYPKTGLPITATRMPAGATPTDIVTIFENVTNGTTEDTKIKPFAKGLQPQAGQLNTVQTLSEFNDRINTLIPLSNGELANPAQQNTRQVHFNAFNRLTKIRQANAGNNISPNTSLPNYSSLTLNYSAGDKPQPKGAWVQAFVNNMYQDAKSLVPGFFMHNLGIAFGVDTTFNDNLILGLGGSYASNHLTSGMITSSYLDTDSVYGMLYGSFNFGGLGIERLIAPEALYINMILSTTANSYRTTHTFLGGGPTAIGDFGGTQYSIATEMGYELINHNFAIIPKATYHYSRLSVNSYTEAGAGALNRTVNYRNITESVLGTALSMAFQMSWLCHTVWTHELHFGLYHDFIGDAQVSTARFAGGGGTFIAAGPTPDKNLRQIGFSIEVAQNDRLFVTLDYNYETTKSMRNKYAAIHYRYEWA